MQKYNEATINRPEGDRPVDAPMIIIDLPAVIDQLKSEEAWSKNDKNAITAFKTDEMRIVVITLHENAEMQPQTEEGVVSLQVVSGKIRFSTGYDSTEISKGQIITVHKGITHSVRALEETVLVLTMSWCGETEFENGGL